MTKSVEILIELNGEKYYLDYDKLDGISLNYNINRIQELENLNSSYSQSIKLVNSMNNQTVLGYICNLNIENGTFDPNKKTKAYILVDSVVVFDGNLQVLGISYNDNLEVFYDSVIYADNSNLYTSIENKFLQDLDFSRFVYFYDFDNFLSTATSSCDKDAIIFPLIDYGANWKYNEISGTGSSLGSSASTIEMSELYPAFYTKTIFDQIFIDAGYKYESDFLSGTISDFRKLVIPFNNENLLNQEVQPNNFFGVEANSNTDFIQSPTSSIPYKGNIYYVDKYIDTTASNRYYPDDYYYQNDEISRFERFGIDLDLTLLLGRYDIELDETINQTSEFFLYHTVQQQNVDVVFYRQYNPSTNSLDAQPTNEFYRQPLFKSNSTSALVRPPFNQGNTTYVNTFMNTNVFTPNGALNPIGLAYTFLTDKVSVDRNGFLVYYNPTASGFNLKYCYQDLSRVRSNETLFTPWLDGSVKSLIALKPNEKISVVIEIKYGQTPTGVSPYNRIFYKNPNILINIAGSYPAKNSLFSTTYSNTFDGRTTFTASGWTKDTSLTYINRFKNEVTNEVGIGTSLPISPNLPSNVKQIDFLKSIIKMFNLYVEPVKDKINTFLIEPRDDYYKNSQVKDWSKLIDLNEEVESDILSSTQAKETIFKYTEDDDFYNDLYMKSFNEVYGQYKHINSNEFVTGTNELSIIFSPTVLRNVYDSDITISAIQKDLNFNQIGKTGNIIRILYCDTLNLPGNKTITIEKSIFTYYIYAGHFDNPYDPLIDLSFNLPKKLYYDFITDGQAKLTYNNLFNLYHRNQFSEINNNDSRLVKVNLMLSELDIYNFKFSDTIYIWVNENVNGYFRVNSINEYNPMETTSTRVELIKIDYTPSAEVISSTRLETSLIRGNSFVLGSLNTFDSNNTVINGRRNDVKGLYNRVDGDNNILVGNSLKISGQNNNIEGSSINVSGDGNNITGDTIDVNGSLNISTYSISNGRITGNFNEILQPVNNLQISGNGNLIGNAGLTATIESNFIFGNNNQIDKMPNVFILGNGNSFTYSVSLGFDKLYFVGDDTVLDVKYVNKFTLAPDLTFQSKKIVVDGIDNRLSSSNALVFGSNNSIRSDFNTVLGSDNFIDSDDSSIGNFIVGNENTFGSSSSNNFLLGSENIMLNSNVGNLVLGNGNVIGDIVNKSIIIGSDNVINAVDTGGNYIQLDNLFIMSNSTGTTYNLTSNMFFIDLQNDDVITRFKNGPGKFNSIDGQNDYSSYQEVSNRNLNRVKAQSGVGLNNTFIGNESMKPFYFEKYYTSIGTQSVYVVNSYSEDKFCDILKTKYSYATSSGSIFTFNPTQSVSNISTYDNLNMNQVNTLMIVDVETIVRSNTGASQFSKTNYAFIKDTLYIYSNSSSPFFVIDSIDNVTTKNTYPIAISVTYSFVESIDQVKLRSTVNIPTFSSTNSNDVNLNIYTNWKFRNTNEADNPSF